MNPKHFGRAMQDVTNLADGVMDERLKSLAKPAPPLAVEGEEASEGMEPDELTPDEVARLRALLAQEG